MTPTIDAARKMGETGGSVSDDERLAFEAWIEGHCWSLGATWDGSGYWSDHERMNHGWPDPGAIRTRQLWAAWRDRAALGDQPSDDTAIKAALAAERERCAKVCEQRKSNWNYCAESIRALGA